MTVQIELHGVKEEFLLCRRSVLGHSWEFYEPPFDRPQDRVWKDRVTKRCTRCGTVNHVGVDTIGTVMMRDYRYPDGYTFPKGQAPSGDDLRLWMTDKYRREVANERRRRTRANRQRVAAS